MKLNTTYRIDSGHSIRLATVMIPMLGLTAAAVAAEERPRTGYVVEVGEVAKLPGHALMQRDTIVAVLCGLRGGIAFDAPGFANADSFRFVLSDTARLGQVLRIASFAAPEIDTGGAAPMPASRFRNSGWTRLCAAKKRMYFRL